jgi:hypothetical protein
VRANYSKVELRTGKLQHRVTRTRVKVSKLLEFRRLLLPAPTIDWATAAEGLEILERCA